MGIVPMSEGVRQRAERLVELVDAGVPVAEAATALGLSRNRGYQLLQVMGRRVRPPWPSISPDQTERVVAGFDQTGTIAGAGRAGGVAPNTARKILNAAGRLEGGRRPKGKVEEKRRFLELLDAGWSLVRAAREVGVNPRTGRDWRQGIRRLGNTRVYPDGRVVTYATATGYTVPMVTTPEIAPPRVSDRYLSLQERLAIADGLLLKHTITDIAARIGRHKSTLSREVSARSIAGVYLPYRAHEAAAVARARPKEAKLVVNQALRAEVEEGLAQRRSPEQIAHRLRKDYPDDESMRVSHETIYQALYFQARGGLKREVQQALRTGRTRRKPHRGSTQRTPRFVDEMIMISDRPAEVEDRAVPGHWEGDLIMGEGNKTAIGTLVERATRYTMLVHLPNGHDSESMRDGLIRTIEMLPTHLRGSLTWDQGCEMARHKQFTMATDMAVYFCDPASPWQRGSNENTNGLLRQYFPKSTDLSIYGPEDLEHVAQQLNSRPRKTLHWDTPAERLRDLLSG